MRELIMGIKDKGGRRSGIERRKFSILEYTPERRSGQERRSNEERRSEGGSVETPYLKRGTDRYVEFANTQRGLFFAILLSFPLWALIIFMVINKIHL